MHWGLPNVNPGFRIPIDFTSNRKSFHLDRNAPCSLINPSTSYYPPSCSLNLKALQHPECQKQQAQQQQQQQLSTTTRCDRLACFNSNTRNKLQSVPYCAHVAAAAVGDGGGGATAGLRGILSHILDKSVKAPCCCRQRKCTFF